MWNTSGGDPFVVVETVRALEETGPMEAAGIVAVPGRVRNLVRGRLERLGDASRQIVEVAAVVGGAVDFEVLQRATTLTGMQTATGLEELVRRRVLHVVGEDFDFTHELIRRVVDDDSSATSAGSCTAPSVGRSRVSMRPTSTTPTTA